MAFDHQPYEKKQVTNFEALIRSKGMLVVESEKAIAIQCENIMSVDKPLPSTLEELRVISELFPRRVSPRSYFCKQSCTYANDVISNVRLDFTQILPKEILRVIFMYLNPASYSSVVCVCKTWHELESQEVIEFISCFNSCLDLEILLWTILPQ